MKNEKFGADEIYLAPETNLPNDVFPENDGISEEMAGTDISVMVEAEPKVSVRVSEILNLREDNRKVYRMSDGTEQAVYYPETIHVFDQNTKIFDDVENTLVEEEDGRHFVNGKNKFVARFSREKDNDELFSIESGMHRVTVSAKKSKKQRNKRVVPKAREKADDSIMTPDTLVFENIQDGSDYEYSVTGNGVKENIIVREKTDVYRYSFVLHLENVTAQYVEDNKSIAFISNETGEEVFLIPAPFMTDANGVASTAVSYEIKQEATGNMILNVVADNEWMHEEGRAFPVIIDPQILLVGNHAMNTYSWNDGSLYSSPLHAIGTVCNEDGSYNVKRMYMSLSLPHLPRNPRIKKAEIKIYQESSTSVCKGCPKLGLYQESDEISLGEFTPENESNLIDFAKMQIGHCEEGAVVGYTFDVTTLVDQVNKGEVGTKNLVLKMIDEASACDNCITLYGSTSSGQCVPQFIVTYESTYAVNSFYRTHSHELGRFGQGNIDLQCGNLMFDSEDFSWAGNRMPVTIKHLYNSALDSYQYTKNDDIMLPTADFSAMKLGYGFKLNIMQSMMPTDFQHEGELYTGYVYIGENGEEVCFKQSETKVCCSSHSHCYHLYEDVNGGDMLYDPEKLTLTQGDEVYQFDESGRLIKITDASSNFMDITYNSNRIASVTDGAGRHFWFAYSDIGFLTSITAPDNTSVLYTYSDDLLQTIIYPDGKKATITYYSSKPVAVTLFDVGGAKAYKVEYAYNGDRLFQVTEYGVKEGALIKGAESVYSYSAASGRTIVQTTEQSDEDEGETADNVIKTVYTFDDDGNVVSEYMYSEDTGNVDVNGEGSGIHPYSGDGGAGVVSNINNLLIGHNFESLDSWDPMPSNNDDFNIKLYSGSSSAKFGKKYLYMCSCHEDSSDNGLYQETGLLPAGQYTFSAYLRVGTKFSGCETSGVTPGAFIRVMDTLNNVLGVSEYLISHDKDYTRLIVPFELTEAKRVHVQILTNGRGVVYVDAAQLENNPYANAYNMLENGNFERGTDGWECSTDVFGSEDVCFNMSKSLAMNGAIEANRYAYQTVTVRPTRATRETFTLSGWAKGYGLPNHERDSVATPTFRLRAVVKYSDSAYREYGTEEFTADFSPCTEEWQFASVQFSKSKCRIVECVYVYCDYGHNSGTVYFDDIQLVRNSVETDLSDPDFVEAGNGVSEDEVEESIETENDPSLDFSEARDAYGNTLTETTFTDGEFGTIYRAFGFTSDENNAPNAGNDLLRETDARGNLIQYTVDEETSRNEEVTDRCGNKTAYEYDDSGRTIMVTSKDATGTPLANVSYNYDAFDNMTEIVRGDGMKYVLAYNAFHNLESIGIEGKTDGNLVTYAYKNGNGRLKQVTYANGDTMKATYNSVGQMIAEKWFDSTGSLTAYYKYVYDGQGNIVRSLDMTANKEYNYEYEEGRIIRTTESDVTFNANEIVVSKTVVNTVKYYYDAEGKMTRKVITPASGSAHTVHYETNDDNTVVKFSAGGKMVTSHSKTDSFGRKVFDELQLGTGFISRQFSYHAGEVTEKHRENDKLKSSATTQLVSRIILSDDRTLSYEYDAEERITKVTDSVDGVTEYTYDALGQLLTETVNGVVVNSMKYDNYGNIVQKNGIEYTYGDGAWRDLLTSYNGQVIEYDAQGNPTNYLGHALTWEKGRQLKSFDGNTYTYNANGIRTSKTVEGVTHTYTLDGTKILRETWGDNTLVPLYDNEDSVCGILYNDEPYYFVKNLQGDVIAIVDKDADTVARYSYDAWGVCTADPNTTANEIATINPFRYRSYYFDRETGLYYLQSRLFDTQTCRFVTSDNVYILFKHRKFVKYNLYEYCNNVPTVYVDPLGDDAILLLYARSALYAGHLSAMVQDYWGNWYYFYWGAKKPRGIWTFLGFPVKQYHKFDSLYTSGTCPWKGYSNIKCFLESRDELSTDSIRYSDGLSGAIYLAGSFVNSYNYFKNSSNFRYNLFNYNCAQAVLAGLDLGYLYFDNLRFHRLIRKNYNLVIPNMIFTSFMLAYGAIYLK